MTRGVFDVTVADTGNLPRLLKQLRVYAKRRVPALQGYVAEQAAEAVRAGIMARVNGTELAAVYLKSLSVARVAGVPAARGVAYTLRVNPQAERVTPVLAKKSILVVVPRASVLVPPLPEVLILKHHGPWTPETLPFVPRARHARVFYRTVGAPEAAAVAARQRDPAQRRKIKTLLDRVGFRPPRADLALQTPRVVTAIPDAAYAGFRAEFGYGGGAKVTHWRPALRDLKQGGLKAILKAKVFRAAVGRATATAWQRWPPRTVDNVSRQDTMRYKSFEKSVRIR